MKFDDEDLAECLIMTNGDCELAAVLADTTVEEFSQRLKRSQIIQEAMAEVGADNLAFEPQELADAVRTSKPWAIMVQLDNSGRFPRNKLGGSRKV